MLRVGVIGLGVMGKNHARVIHETQGLNLVSIFDPLVNQVESFLGAPVTRSLEIFFSQTLDYCVIASPTVTHHEMALHAAMNGVPAIIEKPIAATITEADEIIRAFAERGLVASVGHIERFNPALIAAKKFIAGGSLGNIIQINTRRQGPFPGRISDVGVIKDLATHDIDLACWLGEASYGDITAKTKFRSGRSHEDLVMTLGSLTNGVIVSHMVNWLSPSKERLTAILGERGLLLADTLNVDLYFFENGMVSGTWDEMAKFKGVSEGNTTKFALNRKEPLVAEHEAFVLALQEGNSAGIVTLDEGREVLRIAESISDV